MRATATSAARRDARGASRDERPRIKDQLDVNERLLQETGCLFGLTTLRRKQADPGTYEAVWHILLNTMDAAWDVGCKVSASPIAA